MLSKSWPIRCMVLTVLLGLVAWVPAFGGSAVIGLVAGSSNATIGGQAVAPNATVFSGDSLQVSDGVAVVAIGAGSRMVFGRETIASFLRDPDEVMILLSRGNVLLFHPGSGSAVRVKAGDVSIVPARGFKTVGEIAMVGDTLVVTAKEGSLRVEGNGTPLEVAKGKTITVAARTPSPSPAAPPPIGAVSSAVALSVASTASAATGAVLSGVAISRANGAKDAAAAANVTAGQAVSAANAANSTAASAVSAANAATSAANAANSTAIGVGCSINKVAVSSGISPSPFTPPKGSPTC